ncbi:carcinoembryonic antigen-related cell adhesion molecule 20-like [Labeo rohita]|uniref:carcinoembryonic antigen-related cell adhesion molecule 20-like n=1 Tax=Labeo rohita TaxID=84645 RepID=UPI0021E31F60|nr:carcinoembryonic antigen-related cell adhesion molecule 20-like [Labeo rohita]
MDSHGLYWTLWMLLCFGQYLGDDLQFSEPANGAIGGYVVLIPDYPPYTSIDVIQWHFGTTLIMTDQSGEITVSPGYGGRITFDRRSLALVLWDLRLSDSGKYRLTVVTSASAQLTGETSLQVFERITDVKLIGPEEILIEDESIANITSEGTGHITSVQWMKDKIPLSSSDRIFFSSDNRSLLISPVQRSDTGDYQCIYSNPGTSMTRKISLVINYGPDNISIAGPNVVNVGDPVSLVCSASSQPPASFAWRFNGTEIGVTTKTFTINQTDLTHSGEYDCVIKNSITIYFAVVFHPLLVKEGGGEGSEGGGGGWLTTGAIAGIVIGAIVAVAGICGLIVYLTTTKIPELNL